MCPFPAEVERGDALLFSFGAYTVNQRLLCGLKFSAMFFTFLSFFVGDCCLK